MQSILPADKLYTHII